MDALTTPHKTLFLSYSRKQTAWCDELYVAIDANPNYQRWRDNKIPESADWWHSICLNIEGCFAFVAILTPDYLASAYCMGELRYALKLRKPVIALMLEEVEYPTELNVKRTQFPRVAGLDMATVMNKVLSACNEITLAYMRDEYSRDIAPRPASSRPQVPTPSAAVQITEEDTTLSQQIDTVRVHGEVATRDLLSRFNEEKGRNLELARNLLEKISQRKDVPSFFDFEEEDTDLKIAEAQHAQQERERERLKRASEEYEELTHYTTTATRSTAARVVHRFFTKYPDYTDAKALRQKYRPNTTDLMTSPFAWIEILGNTGTIQAEGDVTLTIPTENYWISKYPITNAQYTKFIEAGGYREQKWWTETGWEAKQKGWTWDEGRKKWTETNNPWTKPGYWQGNLLSGPDQPVIGASWYEAVAFCLWLSETTDENIMLATEAQWQYAAQSKDNRKYPWGNNKDRARCNIKESGLGRTTPVSQYEGKGDSPFGVVNMAGNVWEWCLTDYDNCTNDFRTTASRRVLRGGSWNQDGDLARVTYRGSHSPHARFYDYGFRVVRTDLTSA